MGTWARPLLGKVLVVLPGKDVHGGRAPLHILWLGCVAALRAGALPDRLSDFLSQAGGGEGAVSEAAPPRFPASRPPARPQLEFKCVSEVQPTPEQLEDLKFAWLCVKHVKSNAITGGRAGGGAAPPEGLTGSLLPQRGWCSCAVGTVQPVGQPI